MFVKSLVKLGPIVNNFLWNFFTKVAGASWKLIFLERTLSLIFWGVANYEVEPPHILLHDTSFKIWSFNRTLII